MSNPEHVEILRAGKKAWREWRKQSDERPDLSGEKLLHLDLSYLDLNGADMRKASLWGSLLRNAKLAGADLSGCMARFVSFSGAKLAGAKLVEADLRAGSLRRADLAGADLTRAVLRFTSLVGANVEGAIFREAEVYGVSAWNLSGEPADQTGLVIRADNKPETVTTTVDDIDTAQLLSLLRENAKIADVINTASQRTVLLLGRFKPSYKKVLDALRTHLLNRNLVPVMFDFDRPAGRDLTETVASLAHMACFVIPDLSGAKSVPQELSTIVPFLPSVPVVPVIAESNEQVYSMFEHFLRYPWVHKPVTYRDLDHLLSIVDEQVIDVGFRAAMKARGMPDAELPALPEAYRA
jgi:uncharacterized protein YjbI with pentapeptide repeats